MIRTSIVRIKTLHRHLLMSTSSSHPTVLTTQKKNATIMTLNRPKKLNSLTLQMVRELDQALTQGQNSSCLIMDGAGGKAFCAGGDVATVRAAGLSDDASLTRDFFFEEYRLNKKIGDVNKTIPQVSIWNGITMGGGVGVSIHGKYRVATEKSLFAKPETGIGLFPDVGASVFLSEMPGCTGEYIALTGARLKANDLIYAGLSTHYVSSEMIPDLYESLSNVSVSRDQINAVQDVLDNYQKQTGPIDVNDGIFGKHRTTIDTAFSKHTVEEIVATLHEISLSSTSTKETQQFATETLQSLQNMSPTSLKITLQQVRRAKKGMSLGDALKMEYRICQTLMKNTESDFYEGIRAVLVDKDRNPKWNPKTLEEVSDEEVERHFQHLATDEELRFD